MSENTKIEWADHTFNPWIGCVAISPGCVNCYAADWAKRYGRDFAARTRTKTWGDPVKWNARHDAFHSQHGRRQRVFCASLADVFDNAVDPQWRADLFELIRATPNLDWLLLTKRIGNVDAMIEAAGGWPANAKLGITVVDQKEADRDIPRALKVKEKHAIRVLFLSIEPQLGPVSFEGQWVNHANPAMHENMLEALDWVIVGGESGPGARPMHPDWARSLRDQCEAAGVPFLFKQWGNWRAAAWFDGPDADSDAGDDFVDLDRVNHHFLAVDGRTWDTNGGRYMYPPMPLGHWCLMVNEGKKAAGRQLDGRTWDGFPS